MEDKYVGKRLDGRYEIHELIGVGGMAYVYKAFDRNEDRWVAIKILKDEFAGNSEFLRRFRNESRAIAMLSHQNIVKVFDVSFGDRIQYIVMEFINGITLKDYINRKGVLVWKEAVYFTGQILSALEHAHSKNIIHRDIKPQNIILLQDGTIKVTDFGIARFSQSETQTMTDKAMGSVHYIAPEQAKGEYTTPKADIYSLGVIMYEMLTGQLPFEAENAVSVAIMQLQAEPQRPRIINPQIPVGLEEITMKAMEKKTAVRFQSAAEMLEDVEKFRQNPAIIFNYKQLQDSQATIQMDTYDDVRSVAPEYGDDYEYDAELVKSKRHAKGSMIITGVVAAVILALLAFGVYLVVDFINNNSKEDVKSTELLLPDMIGKNYYSEIENNSKYPFNFTITEDIDSSKEQGIILDQSPKGGLYIKKDSEVTIVVNRSSDKTEKVDVPDLVGKSQTDAHNALTELGFVPKVELVSNDETAADFVIKTSPKGGSSADKGATVTIYVSKGPSEVKVPIPDIIDSSLTRATELLEESKLKVGNVSYDEESEADKDTVLRCSPEVGEKVSEDSSVDLVLSAGNKREKSVDASIKLPAGVNMELGLKIFLDGVVVEEATVNPFYSGSYSTSFTGTEGQKQVVVTLDSQQYMFATVDFDAESFEVNNIEPFVPVEPEPTPTVEPEPTTEPEPTQEPDTTTEPDSGEGEAGTGDTPAVG